MKFDAEAGQAAALGVVLPFKDKHGVNVSLVLVKPNGETKEVSVKPGRITIGRESHCHIRVPVASVSRKHCEIQNDGQRVLVKDNNSSNGTYVNKGRIDGGRELSAGDIVAIGPALFVLRLDGQPAEIDPAHVIATGRPDDGVAEGKGPAAAGQEKPEKAGQDPLLGGGDPDESSVMDFDLDLDDDDDQPPL